MSNPSVETLGVLDEFITAFKGYSSSIPPKELEGILERHVREQWEKLAPAFLGLAEATKQRISRSERETIGQTLVGIGWEQSNQQDGQVWVKINNGIRRLYLPFTLIPKGVSGKINSIVPGRKTVVAAQEQLLKKIGVLNEKVPFTNLADTTQMYFPNSDAQHKSDRNMGLYTRDISGGTRQKIQQLYVAPVGGQDSLIELVRVASFPFGIEGKAVSKAMATIPFVHGWLGLSTKDVESLFPNTRET
ncbi:MAG: hypothetical protein WCO06_06305 [Candidatus Roizmanbacteria bacterium]